jgi:hypothetical protein
VLTKKEFESSFHPLYLDIAMDGSIRKTAPMGHYWVLKPDIKKGGQIVI